MSSALDGGQPELKVGEWAIMLCLYAAERIKFQDGRLKTEQLDKICEPYYDCTMEEIQELRQQIVFAESDEACRKLLAPLLP